ncbi:MAG: InlB B-repeat-containing protein [Clostridia bacterium]|nr:InlB B-repeat-containing protein [Clostridia bacterium]
MTGTERLTFKRILSMLTVIVMLLSVMPAQVFAATYYYNANSYPTTITVTDSSGNRVTGASITVTSVYWGRNDTHIVKEGTNGQYYFSRSGNNTMTTYTITVSKDGYESVTTTMRGNVTSVSVKLPVIVSEFASFRVYYTADGHIPDNGYQAVNDPVDYGPSADDTPLVLINVNLTKLRAIASEENSPVIYASGSNLASTNQYEFVPRGSHTDADYLENVEAFWDAVLTCVDEESIKAFEETGLFDKFMGYCLKKQQGGSQHLDGILNVVPPVYVVELYQNEVYFGGGVTDAEHNTKFLTAYDILDQYEAHLKQTITWVEDENGKPKLSDNDSYTGTYVDPATNKIHNIEVFQTNKQNAQAVENSEIPYTKQTDSYYLAQFNMSVDEGTKIRFLVTYTDGVDGSIFYAHEYEAGRNEVVPAFTGVTSREGYKFLGWYLDGSQSGTVYSDEQIANMTVTNDMTFHAVWELIPKYTGTVTVVINGTYDAATQTLTSGTLADIETPLGLTGDATVYLSTDEKEYIPLTSERTGVYTAALENGIYHAYYSQDGGSSFVKITDQPLIIEGMDRTRYLFYNTVYHDLNGGTLDGSTENILEYFHAGDRVISGHEQDPVREGYKFAGWLTNDGALHNTGDVVTESIDRAYIVTAQWIKIADVYVSIRINHFAKDGNGFNTDSAKHNIDFTVDERAGTSGDYTELLRESIVWDGASPYTDEQYEYSYTNKTGENYTSYVSKVPVLTDVPADNSYTVTSNKSGYLVESVTQETDENGDIHVYAVISYDPNEFDFTYTVTLDDAAKKLDSSLWPKAVNVKVSSYENGNWLAIQEHTETYERVEIDENGEGSGFYPVWISTTEQEAQKYYYRIEVVSYEMQDGTVVPASSADNIHFDAIDKSYLSEVVITGGKSPADGALPGVWYDGDSQQGSAQAIVSIPVYTVTFIPNGGTLGGSFANTVLENQIIMPNVHSYLPERNGGYIFEGWYVYEDGMMTDTEAVAGSALTSDVTLIAKWRDPISVEGIVTFAATYDQQNEDGSVTVQYLNDFDRVKNARILLQKKTPAGYYETVDWRELTLDYSNEYYYFQKTESLKVPVGFANYSFTGLADDGSEYRVYVLTPNFSETFQNEPESVTSEKAYNTYTSTDYDALLGTVRPEVATVNVHLHFEPRSFDLDFKVDATAIGESLRPHRAEVAITCNIDPAIVESHKWPVITQMIFDGKVKGYEAELTNGAFTGTDSVWINTTDGVTLYDYGMTLVSTTSDGTKTDYADNPFFTVEYQAPAHFDTQTGEQSQLLVAMLLPKTYNVKYEANGGIITGTHVSTHTWSFDTQLSEVTPSRPGYAFMGWYEDEALTVPMSADVIDASVHEDVTYYAKWLQIMDRVNLEITIDHSTDDDGYSDDSDKDMTVTLSRRERNTTADFIQITGQDVVFDSTQWNTSGDKIETFTAEDVFVNLSSQYDYNLFVSLDGYYVDPESSSVEKVTAEDGSTEHNVKIYLKYNPDLLHLDFSVEMAQDVETGLYPLYADVKVTSFADGEWRIITQHESKLVKVVIDQETGIGHGTYPVWQWLSEEYGVPYYYRIEVVALKLQDGTLTELSETQTETVYEGGGYTATIYAEDGCEKPKDVDSDGNVTDADTELYGAFGVDVDAESTDVSYTYVQNGTLRAVIDVPYVRFHANNEDALCHDINTGTDLFRTYYPSECALPLGEYYSLNADYSVPEFYDIPAFEYNTQNEYIFKGWYTEDGSPWSFENKITEKTDLYAHWIETKTVAKEDDGKQTGSDTYAGFDLAGTQIRDKALDDMAHYGNPASGLRFITVLSEDVYSQINALPGNESGAEYGFAVAKKEHADKRAASFEGDYTVGYNGVNVNGTDTTKAYSYVRNMKCSGVADHFSGENYRLYTAVITYNNLSGDALEAAYATPFVARSYIRYYDANGLYRTYYNNYTGTQLYYGCNTSFAQVRDIISGEGAN